MTQAVVTRTRKPATRAGRELFEGAMKRCAFCQGEETGDNPHLVAPSGVRVCRACGASYGVSCTKEGEWTFTTTSACDWCHAYPYDGCIRPDPPDEEPVCCDVCLRKAAAL